MAAITTLDHDTQVYTALISQTIATGLRRPYSNLDEDVVPWVTRQWLIYIESHLHHNPALLFRGLVLADRIGIFGKLALKFNTALYAAIQCQDILGFQKVLAEASFPELDLNSTLTKKETTNLQTELTQVIYGLQLHTERLLSTASSMTSLAGVGTIDLLHGDLRRACYEDICLRATPSGSLNEAMLTRTDAHHVWMLGSVVIAGTVTHQQWCFNLLELFEIISKNASNPYTGVPFEAETLADLRASFYIPLKLFAA